MSKRLALLIAAAIMPALTFAAPAHARAQYPYKLIDLGTFGGPSSWLTVLPITSNGTVLHRKVTGMAEASRDPREASAI